MDWFALVLAGVALWTAWKGRGSVSGLAELMRQQQNETDSFLPRIVQLETEIQALSAQVRHLQVAGVPGMAVSGLAAIPSDQAPPRREPRRHGATAPPTPNAEPNAVPETEAVPLRPAGPGEPSAMERLVKRMRGTEEWEALIGTRWLNRIGALALILGIGFFLKYAFDNNWVSETVRIAIGVALGLGLLAGAWQSHRRDYTIFAQGLVGAGIATLYLSVYAASNFYHLISEPVALASMAVVTAVALAQGLYYNSLAVELLGWAGGFVTLPLLGINAGNEIGVIGYLCLLDAGIFLVVYLRDDWFILEPLTLAGSYGAFVGWMSGSYTSSKLVIATVAVSLLWALYFALDLARMAERRTTHSTLRETLGIVNAAVYLGCLALLLHDERRSLGVLSLCLGLVYMASVLAARRSRLADDDRVAARYTVTAITAVVIATPLLFTDPAVEVVWSLGATALLWSGVRVSLRYLWQPAIVLYAVTAGWLMMSSSGLVYTPIERFVPVFNGRVLAFAALAAALIAGALVLRRLDHPARAVLVEVFYYAGCAAVFLLLTAEINDTFRHAMLRRTGLDLTQVEFYRWLALAAVWMLYAFPLVWIGARARIEAVLLSGLVSAALAVGLGMVQGAGYRPIERFVPVLNLRAGTLVLLGAGLLILAWRSRSWREASAWLSHAGPVCLAATALVGFELLTSEIHDGFRHASGALSESAGNSGIFVELMLLTVTWMAASLLLARLNAGPRSPLLGIITISLAALAAVTAGVGGVMFTPDGWLSTALPVRLAALLVVVAGLAIHLLWVRERRIPVPGAAMILVAIEACMVLLGFELVSTEMRDLFSYHVSTALSRGDSADADRWRNLEQLALSGSWLLYAILLMGLGIWRRTRWIRLGSMALLGFIILKIFVYDLSFLGGAYRSISFAGLGVILLLVSFLYQRFRGLILDAA